MIIYIMGIKSGIDHCVYLESGGYILSKLYRDGVFPGGKIAKQKSVALCFSQNTGVI